MIPMLRKENIMGLLREGDVLLLQDLARALDISESTVRRDLKELAETGEVELLRGGGVRLRVEAVAQSIDARLELNAAEKDRIARCAASLVQPGDTIFLDPSSANAMLIGYLTAENVSCVTNSLLHAERLLRAGIPCVLIGGQVKPFTRSCVGAAAEAAMRGYRFNKSFLGANGVSVQLGLTNHDPAEQAIKRLAIEQSMQAFFLVDSSKFGAVAMCQVAAIDECAIIADRPRRELEPFPNILYA